MQLCIGEDGQHIEHLLDWTKQHCTKGWTIQYSVLCELQCIDLLVIQINNGIHHILFTMQALYCFTHISVPTDTLQQNTTHDHVALHCNTSLFVWRTRCSGAAAKLKHLVITPSFYHQFVICFQQRVHHNVVLVFLIYTTHLSHWLTKLESAWPWSRCPRSCATWFLESSPPPTSYSLLQLISTYCYWPIVLPKVIKFWHLKVFPPRTLLLSHCYEYCQRLTMVKIR